MSSPSWVLLFKVIRKKDEFETKDRIMLAIYGALGLIFWGGVILGPLLILIASALPVYNINKKRSKT
jgi:hypothetical protein